MSDRGAKSTHPSSSLSSRLLCGFWFRSAGRSGRSFDVGIAWRRWCWSSCHSLMHYLESFPGCWTGRLSCFSCFGLGHVGQHPCKSWCVPSLRLLFCKRPWVIHADIETPRKDDATLTCTGASLNWAKALSIHQDHSKCWQVQTWSPKSRFSSFIFTEIGVSLHVGIGSFQGSSQEITCHIRSRRVLCSLSSFVGLKCKIKFWCASQHQKLHDLVQF